MTRLLRSQQCESEDHGEEEHLNWRINMEGLWVLKPNINEDIIWISWGYPHVLAFDKPADGLPMATLFSTQMRS